MKAHVLKLSLPTTGNGGYEVRSRFAIVEMAAFNGGNPVTPEKGKLSEGLKASPGKKLFYVRLGSKAPEVGQEIDVTFVKGNIYHGEDAVELSIKESNMVKETREDSVRDAITPGFIKDAALLQGLLKNLSPEYLADKFLERKGEEMARREERRAAGRVATTSKGRNSVREEVLGVETPETDKVGP